MISVLSVMRNWPLLLLAVTSVALSIASGWTTWDGMSNFTREPALSLLITFGIQAVMLTTAWMIGETFANRPMRRRAIADDPTGHADAPRTALRRALAFAFLAAFLTLAFSTLGAGEAGKNASIWEMMLPSPVTPGTVFLAVLISGFIIYALRSTFENFVGIVRVIAHNSFLWVLFIACMAASVFFSFDSLFSVVFPEEDRGRAAQVRAVSGANKILSEIRTRAERESNTHRLELLRSAAWSGYSQSLDRMGDDVKRAEEKLEVAARSNEEQARKATRERLQKAALLEQDVQAKASRRDATAAVLAARKKRFAELQGAVEAYGSEILKKRAEIVAKESEVGAEEQGLGITERRGRGPRYRELSQQLQRLEIDLELLEKQAQVQSEERDKSAAEVASLERDLSKFTADLKTAEALIAAQKGSRTAAVAASEGLSEGASLADQLAALQAAKLAFVQSPSKNSLDDLQARCEVLARMLEAGESVRAQAGMCDSPELRAAAAGFLTSRDALAALDKSCMGGPRGSPEADVVESSLALARQCLQTARLSEDAAAVIRAQINQIENVRDDKSHRFIVTTNAFLDGNRLAYLALAIAVGIDGLVFIAGLLGAASLRSAFATVPAGWDKPVRWADRIMESALSPDKARSAAEALSAIAPLAHMDERHRGVWTHELDLRGREAGARSLLRRIVNAAQTIGVAKRGTDAAERYLLRPEVVEFLTKWTLGARVRDEVDERIAQHREVLLAALRPDPAKNATIITQRLMPSRQREGYSSEFNIAGIEPQHREMVRRFLNAAASLGAVERVGEADRQSVWLLRSDIWPILDEIERDAAEPPPVAEASESAASDMGNLSGRSRPQRAEPSETAPSAESEAAPPRARSQPRNSQVASDTPPALPSSQPEGYRPPAKPAAKSAEKPLARNTDKLTRGATFSLQEDNIIFD